MPDSSDDPVTVRALLSHRAGFDTGLWGYTSRSRTDVALSRDAYQRRLLPGRAPDRAYGYDNLGVGLLGYLTGQVHGTSFARAVEAKVIRPLGLEKTTIGVPDWQAEHLAACHSWDASGQPVKCMAKFAREGYQAEGDVTTTGSDMARFMSALLNGGCLDGTCVLRPETFRQFTDLDMNRLHPDALGMGFLIYEKEMAGRQAIGHDGGQDGFSTSLTLFPESRVGVFVSLFSFVGIPEELDALDDCRFRHPPAYGMIRMGIRCVPSNASRRRSCRRPPHRREPGRPDRPPTWNSRRWPATT